MDGKTINFDNKKVKKSDFYKNKKKIKIDETDVNKILISKKEPYGTNNTLIYFIGYNDNVIIPLCLKLSKVTSYIRELKGKITMAPRVNDKQLFKIIMEYGKKFKG